MLADLSNEVGNARGHGEVMDQPNNASTAWLDGLTDFRQGNGVAPVEKQCDTGRGQLFRNGTANPAAGAGDEITLHGYKIGGTCSVMSQMLMDATERVPPKKSRRAMFGAA